MKNSVLCFLAYPVIMISVMAMSMDVHILTKALLVMSILSVPGIFIVVFIYHLITKNCNTWSIIPSAPMKQKDSQSGYHVTHPFSSAPRF